MKGLKVDTTLDSGDMLSYQRKCLAELSEPSCIFIRTFIGQRRRWCFGPRHEPALDRNGRRWSEEECLHHWLVQLFFCKYCLVLSLPIFIVRVHEILTHALFSLRCQVPLTVLISSILP